MGKLIDGSWVVKSIITSDSSGAYDRLPRTFLEYISKDNKIFLTGDWVLGKSLSDAWNSGLQLSHYLKILNI